MNRRQRYIDAVRRALETGKLPRSVVVMLDTDVAGYYSDYLLVHLDYIEVPQRLRNRGLGTKAMVIITTLADHMGLALALRTGDARNAAFFRRFEFVGMPRMIRNPKSGTPHSQRE